MFEMTIEQERAIREKNRPIVLTASAGSGKTSVLVNRYLYLLSQGNTPDQILTLTFTNDAAQEIKNRVINSLRLQKPEDPSLSAVEDFGCICTIHSFCYRIVNRFGSLLHLPPIQSIVTPFQLAASFQDSYQRWLETLAPNTLSDLLTYWSPKELRELVQEILLDFFHFQSSLSLLSSDSRELRILNKLRDLTLPLHQGLRNRFHKNGRFSFDDLENITLEIFSSSSETVRTLQGQFSFIQVDEFQDTSGIQWEIIRQIVGETPRKLFVVGDPKQSIYRFRKADPKLLGMIKKAIGSQSDDFLKVNFRTAPALLKNINELGHKLFPSSDFEAMEAGVRKTSLENPFQIVKYPSGNTKRDLARFERDKVVETVSHYIKSGGKPKDLTILFRVSERIAEYAEALSRLNIPLSWQSSRQLFEAYDVLDLVSYLKTVLNPMDDMALSSFLSSPYVGYEATDLYELSLRPGGSLFEKLSTVSEKRLEWLVKIIESGTWEPSLLLSQLFSHSPYWPKNTVAFSEFLLGIEESNQDLARLVEQICAWEEEAILYGNAEEKGEDSLRLMTVHAAKGLEFRHVYIVDNLRQTPHRGPILLVKPGQPPGIRYRRGDLIILSEYYQRIQEEAFKEDLEESKRILYVAMTRAIDTLTVFLPEDEELAPANSWACWLTITDQDSRIEN